MTVKTAFIAWTTYGRRSQLIGKQFQTPVFKVHSLKRLYFLAPLRYLLQAIKTLGILRRERPAVTFVQNPPIFAVLVVYLYTVLTGTKFIIDSHSGALLAPWWRWSLPLHAFLSRRALTTLVTNEHLAAVVQRWRAPTFILADIPADFPQGETMPLAGEFNVAVVNTFSPDEPIAEVLAAAAQLPYVHFYITGDLIRAPKSYLVDPPPNVHFTGFLPDPNYIGLLRAAQAIMVLTTDNYTMQRGACEALWLGQPIVTSDWPILRSYFHLGTIYVDNTSEGIVAGVRQMREQYPARKAEILQLQQTRLVEWESKSYALRQLLDQGDRKVRVAAPVEGPAISSD